MKYLFVNDEFRVEYNDEAKAAWALKFYREEFPGARYELKDTHRG